MLACSPANVARHTNQPTQSDLPPAKGDPAHLAIHPAAPRLGHGAHSIGLLCAAVQRLAPFANYTTATRASRRLPSCVLKRGAVRRLYQWSNPFGLCAQLMMASIPSLRRCSVLCLACARRRNQPSALVRRFV